MCAQCDDDDGTGGSGGMHSGSDGNHANKRAHHNALERKRRDHIKDSFTSLRDCVPALQGEKVSTVHLLHNLMFSTIIAFLEILNDMCNRTVVHVCIV